MNIEDLKLPEVKKPLEGNVDVIEGDIVICPRCEVEGSQRLTNGTCDTCGAFWEDDDDDDEDDEFQKALNLLGSSQLMFEGLLKDHKLVNKMGWTLEGQLRNLAMSVSDYLDSYEDA